MFYRSINHQYRFIIIFFSVFVIKQCLTRSLTTSTSQYKDYHLYLVKMPDNYDLVRPIDELNLINSNQTNQLNENSNQNQNPDNLFYSLMDQLINHAPIDFWQLNINESLFSVSPEYYLVVEDYLLNNSLKFELLDENIQNRLNSELQDVASSDVLNANVFPSTPFKLDNYHQMDEINDYLRYLAKRYPETVRTNSIGKTFENRDILAITIRRKSNKRRPNVIIDAGIHPREWITQASALVLISKLVYYFNLNASHTVLDQISFQHNQTEADLVVPIDWTIIPVLNPDGYIYTWIQDRFYRKNRAVPKASPRRAPWSLFSECVGVDLNKNFDYYFALSARSTNPCSDIFSGDQAFSERETAALRNLIIATLPESYVSLHSFGQLITFPTDEKRGKSRNHDQLKEVSRKMALSIKDLEGRAYRYGPHSQYHYSSIGDSVGWASLNNVNLTFRIDLRDKGGLGYIMPKNQIISNGEEVLKALIVIADEIQKNFKSTYY